MLFGDDGNKILSEDQSMVLPPFSDPDHHQPRRFTNTRGGGDDIFMGGGDMSQGLGMHDETAKNLIGSISPLYSATNQNKDHHGGNFAERVVAHDDSHELASMWPSSRKPAEK